MLQLQRMAFEEVGLGIWGGGAQEVPVTEEAGMFAVAEEWDEWDEWHPSIGGKVAARTKIGARRSLEEQSLDENMT